MSSTKVGRNDPCPCGSGKKYKSCCLLAAAAAPAAPPPLDEAGRRRLMQAFQAYQQDDLDEAQRACEQLLQRLRNQPDALHLQGLIAHRRGQLDSALDLIDRALAQAANDSMHSNRGIVLQDMGRMDDAIAAYRRALQLRPDAAAVHCNLGSCLQAQMKWQEAIPAFEACLRLAPRHAPALNGLGYCLMFVDQLPQAEAALRAATEADPKFAHAWTNLGVLNWTRGRLDAALENFHASLAIDPRQADVWDQIGYTLGDANRMEEARAACEKAYELESSPIRDLRRTLLISHVFESREDMLEQRRRFEAGLERLATSDATLPAATPKMFCPGIFNLAYHGDDVLPVLRRVVAMYQRLCPSLKLRAPHVDRPRPADGPVRLGFFTAHVFDHPVAHCFAGLVKELANDAAFEVLLISHQSMPSGDVVKPYEGFAGRFVKVSKNFEEARAQIVDLELDVLAYQDIGMDDLSYFLGFARLARLQCVLGGHPVTTGLPEMDMYVSTALGEAEGAQAHYSERLVKLDPGTALYRRPVLPSVFKDRAALGLPAEGPLYICPMMLQKVHTDFDLAVAEILRLDPRGHVIFFGHPSGGWEKALEARLRRQLDTDQAARLNFLPWIRNRDDFAAVNHHASVVLDPFHFGIGSTAITTFAVGTPLVSWPGAFLRGRAGLVYARLLEVPECVADSQQDYPALAVRIANDPVLRESLHQRILAHSDRFFDSEAYLRSSREFFASLAQAPELMPGAVSAGAA